MAISVNHYCFEIPPFPFFVLFYVFFFVFLFFCLRYYLHRHFILFVVFSLLYDNNNLVDFDDVNKKSDVERGKFCPIKKLR